MHIETGRAQRTTAAVTAIVLLAFVGPPAHSQSTGTCDRPIAQAKLNINNVNATVYPKGGFCCDESYEQPAGSGLSPLFSKQIWFGGLVDGEFRAFAGTFGGSDLWTGPVFPGVTAPPNCEDFDRIYSISRDDLLRFEAGESPVRDLRDWPTGLGAPTIDADGFEIVLTAEGVLEHVDSAGAVMFEESMTFEQRLDRTIDLASGERPKLVGDRMLWWIMNDVGNDHGQTPPLGMEVHGTAFAFSAPGAIGNITFHRFRFLYKADRPIEDAYVSVWLDTDLGAHRDDYVGVDTVLGLGFTYNAIDADAVYGAPAPAFGADFFQGPLANVDGLDNDKDGAIDEIGERLQMTSFMRLINITDGGQAYEEDPQTANELHRVLQGRWVDGAPMTYGGNGRDFTTTVTTFQYPGDPVVGAYWSEVNIDGDGTSNIANDRRFTVSSGPFDMNPGDTEEIVYGLIWSRGDDNLDSIRKLREDDLLAQALFDIDFQVAAPPNAPEVTAIPLDGKVVLEWSNSNLSNNYLDSYREVDKLLSPDVEDNDYLFEGYNIFQYSGREDQEGKLIAVYDVANGITRVIEGDPLNFVTADGTDSGVKHHHVIDGLTNYQTYSFGVQAYAYNEASGRKVYLGPVSRIEVVPTREDNLKGGTVLNSEPGDAVEAVFQGDFAGGKRVSVQVTNPRMVTGHQYEVRFYEVNLSSDPENPAPATNYDIRDLATGEKVFDGSTALAAFGDVAPQGPDVQVIDGLSWSIEGPPPDALDIQGTAHSVGGGNPAFIQVEGLGDDDACGPSAGSTGGCSEVGGNNVYGSLNGQESWIMFSPGEGFGPEERIGLFAPNDFEIRSTPRGSFAYHAFSGSGVVIEVPWEVWDIGSTGPFGVNDPSDDEQMVGVLFSDDGGECVFGFGEIDDPFGLGWPATDRIYAFYLISGVTYSEWESTVKPLLDAHPERCPASPVTDDAAALIDTPRNRPIQRIMFAMDSTHSTFRQEFIPPGNVVRFLTTKPFSPGDTYLLDVAHLAVETEAEEALALDEIGVVPNPYRGASVYEISEQSDEVRFTNMPEQAIVRVFDLAGSLIRVLEKNSPESYLRWDLLTDTGLPIGSGVYFIHVDVPGIGEHALKFAVVRKKTQLPFAR